MSKTWVYQDTKQVAKYGGDAASWYAGWLDTEGKRRCQSCGPGKAGHKAAQKLADKIHSELVEGTYKRDLDKKKWSDFREKYETDILAKKGPSTRRMTLEVLELFEKHVGPKLMKTIKTATIDEFVRKRRQDRGKYPGETVSPATVNKDLRHLRAVIRKAFKWGWLDKLPEFEFEKEPQKEATYVTPEDFAKMYVACDSATLPTGQGFTPGDWWRALLIFAYLTGWRINEILSLRREDIDKDGRAKTRAEDNKGKRDGRVKLLPIVLEHLARLPGFGVYVFDWIWSERKLYEHFARIQKAAGIALECAHDHDEHTEFCRVYGFHDLRRAFATMNATRIAPKQLQALMRHKSFKTTERYINITSHLDEAAAKLHVPELPKLAIEG